MIAVTNRVHKEPIYCRRVSEDLAATLQRDQATAALVRARPPSLVQP